MRARSDPDVQTIIRETAPRVIPPDTWAADRAADQLEVLGLRQRWVDAGVWRPMSVELAGRMLGAAFEEAGVAMAEANDAAG
ncbi:MAG: hypothetical protein ABW321_07225, partial [Polyangiales bacterium]